MTRDQALARVALAVSSRWPNEAEEILDALLSPPFVGPRYAPPGAFHAQLVVNNVRVGEFSRNVVSGATYREPLHVGDDFFSRRPDGHSRPPVMDLEIQFGKLRLDLSTAPDAPDG